MKVKTLIKILKNENLNKSLKVGSPQYLNDTMNIESFDNIIGATGTTNAAYIIDTTCIVSPTYYGFSELTLQEFIDQLEKINPEFEVYWPKYNKSNKLTYQNRIPIGATQSSSNYIYLIDDFNAHKYINIIDEEC